MTEKQMKAFLKEAFDRIAEAFPSVTVDYGYDYNPKKSRWELTYFLWTDEKEGVGAAYIKPDQLKDDKYIADMKRTFVNNMKNSIMKQFNLIPLVLG